MKEDRLPPLVRDVGPWTIQKLTFLREYLVAYVIATQSIKRSPVCFMDLFAGPGWDRNRDTNEVVEGSPLIAMSLYPGFRRFVFVELEPAHTQQLREIILEHNLARVASVITGDCNRVIGQALTRVPKDGATFCFIDPAGLHVEWETIRRIAVHKPGRKVEQLILFPYDMSLVRFLAWERRPEDIWGPEVERQIDLAMPDDVRWRRVYQARNQGEITPREARRRFAYIYWMGLKSLGYEFVLKPKLLSSESGHPLYFLLFATDHPAGDRIMTHVFTKPRGFEQLHLPILEDPWNFREGEAWYENISMG
jgi:three-Cys-motif partner protein